LSFLRLTLGAIAGRCGRSRRQNLVSAATCILLVFCLISEDLPAWAQTSGNGTALLSAELAPVQVPSRSGAPISVLWTLKSQSTAVSEGRMEVVVHDGNQVLARVASDEMAIGYGEQQFRMVLPTLETHNPFGAVEMHLQFVGPQQTIDFGTFPLVVPGVWDRRFVVAVCDSWEATPSNTKQEFVQQFRFETYQAEVGDRSVTTHVANVIPESIPGDPLNLCGFDLLIIMGRGFTELKEVQLGAIADWVNAGGSLCVIPEQSAMKPHQLDFLNRLCRRPSALPYALDSKGLLVIPEGSVAADETDAGFHSEGPANSIAQTVNVWKRRFGLGRSALVTGKMEAVSAMDSRLARPLLAFLWKFRYDQTNHFIETGKWRERATDSLNGLGATQREINQAVLDANGNAIGANAYATIRPRDHALAPVPLQTGDHLLARLMPPDLRVVPLKLIAAILFLFVLVIGPLDYFLLGAIRRRRWTWIVFPAVSIGFAWATMNLSNWYMRFDSTRRGVTIVDVGESGKVARSNRFETLFSAVPVDVSTEVSRGILSAMNIQKFSEGSWYSYQQAATRGTENLLDLVAIPRYGGRLPSRYRVDQSLPQWTPQLNRILKCGSAADAPAFDWNGPAQIELFDAAGQVRGDGHEKLKGQIVAAFGPQVRAFVIVGGRLHLVAGEGMILHPDDPQARAVSEYNPNQYFPGQYRAANASFLQDICSVAPAGGLFGVVSQISPHGGRDFDDLTLLDISAPGQWALLVVVENGSDLFVYRKLYSGEGE